MVETPLEATQKSMYKNQNYEACMTTSKIEKVTIQKVQINATIRQCFVMIAILDKKSTHSNFFRTQFIFVLIHVF